MSDVVVTTVGAGNAGGGGGSEPSVPSGGPSVPGAGPGTFAVPASPDRVALSERLSDRLNPILVREVQQALNGRAFLILIGLALLGIVIVAITHAGEGELGRFTGRKAFTMALMILVPLIGLIVPFIAFLSMRQEVSSGTVEHLMLSRLTPGSVVRGKLAAAVVQIVLVLSLFAPLVSLTWLLRGVDVRSIAVMLTVALVAGVSTVSVAICGGALCRWPPARAILVVVLALGFTITSIWVVGTLVYQLLFFSSRVAGPDFSWTWILGLLVPVVAGVGLLMLTASSALTHPNENRSTGFRIYALVGVAVIYGWMAWSTFQSSRTAWGGAPSVSGDGPEVAAALAIATFFFWLFAVTEERHLSPRVRVHVPKSRFLALLAAPFLPGGGRGLLFVLLLAAVTLVGVDRLCHWVDGTGPSPSKLDEAVAAWAYVVFYAGLGCFIRGRLPAGTRGSVLARFALPLAIVLLLLLPTVADLVASGRSVGWSVLHATNPFSTIGEISRGPSRAAYAAPLVLAAVATLLNVPAMVRGVLEVLEASKARRARAA